MKFQVGANIEIVVSEVYTPTNFYIQLREDQDKLGSLMESMNSFYSDHPEVELLMIPAEEVRVGQLVAVVWEDGLWHRGVVRRMMSSMKVEVDYMDYGSRVVMDKKYLYDLMPQFRETDRQAHLAKLHGIAPLQKKWEKRNSSRFMDLVQDDEEEDVEVGDDRIGAEKFLVGKVMAISGNKVELILVDNQSDVAEGHNIGDMLVHEEHARYAGEEDGQVSHAAPGTQASEGSGAGKMLAQSQSVLESLQICLDEVERPLPTQYVDMGEVQSLKRDAIFLSQKIADSKEEGLEDLAREQKDLINRAVGITLRIIMPQLGEFEDDDENEEDSDSESGVGSSLEDSIKGEVMDSFSQEDSMSQSSYFTQSSG
eukprot:GFUD01024898.1.p1 GENE.GFUD01024898.1~~GFUD01024898.1.p1  ORF type:complete len:369 (-),score=129.62 GFUD01024898.1:67-1173(-)